MEIYYSTWLRLPISPSKSGKSIDIVFDNECYQSCDSFPSATASGVDLEFLAKGCGIKNTLTARTSEEFEATLDRALAGNELVFIVDKVMPGEDLVSLPRQEGRENISVCQIRGTDGEHSHHQSILTAAEGRLYTRVLAKGSYDDEAMYF